MHGGHIIKKHRKSQHYIIHNLVSSNHTSFIEDFPATYGGHYSHSEHAYKHTFTHAYTPKYILKTVFWHRIQKLIHSISKNLMCLLVYAKMITKSNSKQSSNSKHC